MVSNGNDGAPASPVPTRHWQLMLAEGALLLVLGVLAILLPLFAGLVVALLLGWLLFAAGVFGLATSLAARHASGFWWSLLSSLIALLAGALLVLFPVSGLLSLTLVLGAFLFADGVVTIMLSLSHRVGNGNWGWMLLNGILDIVLAAAIFVLAPGIAAWVVGTILGIDLLFGGGALIAMALTARSAA